jgi:hypothetical protein
VKRLSAFAVAVLALLLLLAAPASASSPCTYNCPPPTLGVSATSVAINQTLVVTGSNWCPGTSVQISLDATAVAVGSVDPTGSFKTKFKIPVTSVGTHTVNANGQDSTCSPASVSVTITVKATDHFTSALAPAGVGHGGRPSSGVTVGDVSLLLLVAGLAIGLVRRRRVKAT